MSIRQLITFAITIAAIWLMNRASSASAKKRPGRPPGSRPEEGESERTRQVREEVLRKIRERQGRVADAARRSFRIPPPPPVMETEPADEPPEWQADPLLVPPRPAPRVTMPDDQDEKVLAAQRKLQAQITALEKDEVDVGRQALVSPLAGPPSSSGPALPSLIGAQDLKRAVIWREILGPPIALRR